MTTPENSFQDILDRTAYESKATANIAGILGRHAGLRRPRILKGPGFSTDQDLEDLLETAETTGALTAADIKDLTAPERDRHRHQQDHHGTGLRRRRRYP